MNEQHPPFGIEWTRLPRPDGTHRPGYTWNPVTGCLHDCGWRMPNGKQASCYAKTLAESPRLASFYPEGFAQHAWHPKRLLEPLKVKEPAGIFLDSMSDLMGHWVPTWQIDKVLDICRQAHWHTFFLLTKHAPRLAQFVFPPNVWVGCSSPPDSFMGHPLSRTQQAAMLARSLQVLSAVDAAVRWMSFEPLSWDVADIISQYPDVLDWAVIGAASQGRTHCPPDPDVLQHLLEVLDAHGVPVFFKGNLRALPEAAAAWRADFPVQGGQL